MNNYLSLEIGGKQRGLLYDFGTLEQIEDITGEDPLEFAFDIKNFKSLREGSNILIYAGLLSNCDYHKVEPDFSYDDVKGWVKRLSPAQILSVITTWGRAKSIVASGEGGTDTRDQNLNVV